MNSLRIFLFAVAILGLAGGFAAAFAGYPEWQSTIWGVSGAVLLAFLLLGWLGAWFGSHFYRNFIETPETAWFTLPSGGIMPLANMALGLKVASALFLVFTVLAALRVLHRGGPEDEP